MKKKNMIGRNPVIQKKEAQKNAFEVKYTVNSTDSPGIFYEYHS
ncbi:MAG: hypothetical protein NTX61_01690 [Bacteroidetes bacterium]|nr:hypothetical protein [Bacteroidota bacterium]